LTGLLKRLRHSLGSLWLGASMRPGRPLCLCGIDANPLDQRRSRSPLSCAQSPPRHGSPVPPAQLPNAGRHP
jgi:hypothetical protein